MFDKFFYSIVFAIGETYVTLLIARAVQGVGSACIGVCGMSLVAQVSIEVLYTHSRKCFPTIQSLIGFVLKKIL